MLPTLAELKKKCAALRLEVVQRGRREAKADYVDVLRKHFLDRDYPLGLPFGEELTPMLCFASWNLKDDELAGIWRNPNWCCDRKFNGCRIALYFRRGLGVFATTRNVSLKTYRFQEVTGKLLFSGFEDMPYDFTLDCEAIVEKSIDTRPYTAKGAVTKTSLHSTTALLALEDNASRRCQREQDAPLRFKIIDVVRSHGRDLRNEPLVTRFDFRKKVYEFLMTTELAAYFDLPEYVTVNKREYLEQVLADGGEGVILKHMMSKYEDSSSRNRAGWVKVKKRIEFDAFVTGFKRGDLDSGYANMVGALEFSVKLTNGKEHVIGMPINMTLEERQRISIYDPETDTVSMIPEYYGRVAEISGQDISARELRLSHCTIDRWRDQAGDVKAADECVVDLEDLKQASEWVG